MGGIKLKQSEFDIVLVSTIDGWKIKESGREIIGPFKDVEKTLGRWLRTHRKEIGINISISGHREIDCPFCEAMLDANYSFCPECGTSLGNIGNVMSNPNARITVEILPDKDFDKIEERISYKKRTQEEE